MSINTVNAPSGVEIRKIAAIPFASQIPNDTGHEGESVGEVIDNIGERTVVLVEDISVETLNDEQSTAIGGDAAKQFVPTHAIIHMVDVGAGLAANGDVAITIGISAGGTQILAATVCTNLIAIDTKFIIDLSAVVKPALAANATIYVKVTTADTTAGAGHLANAYIYGELIPTAA